MKTLNYRWQLVLLVTGLILMGVLPTQAASHRRASTLQVATFQVASNAHIVVGTNPSAALANLQVGDKVSIAYDLENGILVAHRIADGVPHKPHVQSSNSAPCVHHRKASSLAHIHGVIKSVNVQSGTVSIDFEDQHLL